MKRTIKLLVPAFALILIFTLTGCIKMRTHVTFNKDGSSDVDFTIAAEKMSLDLAIQSGLMADPFPDLKKEFQDSGFTVSDYTEGKLTGLRAITHVEDSNELIKALTVLDEGENSSGNMFSNLAGGLKVKKSWFSTKYTLDSTIDTSFDGMGDLGSIMANNMVDFSIAVTLPVKPNSTNATTVSDDGRTLEWQIAMDTENHLTAEVTVPNVKNIAVTAGGLIVLIIILILATRRKKPEPIAIKSEQAEEAPKEENKES